MEPKHGDTRNMRTETDTSMTTFQTPQGSVRLPGFSHTRTVAERFCRNCGWVRTEGIMGALLCPKCYETWKEIG